VSEIFQFDERPDSRSITLEPPSLTLRYNASGEFDETTVTAYALQALPASVFTQVGQLWRQPISVDPEGWSQYIITAPYGQRKRDVGSVGFGFSAGGATLRLRASKEVVDTYAAPGETAVENNAIGVNKDGDVEGADVYIPALRMTYTYRYPQGVVDESLARALAGATAHTNSLPWRGFEAEELLLIGASGTGSDSESEVALEVLASQNATGLSVGDIAGIVKKGHHLLDVIFTPRTVSQRRIQKARQVTIHRIYDSIAFADVFGFE